LCCWFPDLVDRLKRFSQAAIPVSSGVLVLRAAINAVTVMRPARHFADQVVGW